MRPKPTPVLAIVALAALSAWPGASRATAAAAADSVATPPASSASKPAATPKIAASRTDLWKDSDCFGEGSEGAVAATTMPEISCSFSSGLIAAPGSVSGPM